jgi:Domain of unknown function (DUF1906)
MAWLWANTNLSWVGYYLAGAPNLFHSVSQWEGNCKTLINQGWRIAPVWVGYQDPGTLGQQVVPNFLAQDATLGVSDGNLAVAALKADGFGPGSVAYLDIETSTASAQEQRYARSWCATLAASGYGAGIYCPANTAAAYHTLDPNAPIWVAKYYSPSNSAYVQTSDNILPSYDPGLQSTNASAWQYEQGFDSKLPGGWSITIGGSKFGLDLDSGQPVTQLTSPAFLSAVQDGYISGATVFADANGKANLMRARSWLRPTLMGI